MAIAIENSAKATAQPITSGNTLSIANFVVTSGSLLIVFIPQEGTGASTTPSVTWNGGAMTHLTTAAFDVGGNLNRIHVFYLTSPTQTTADIVLTNNNSGIAVLQIYAFSLTGADAPDVDEVNNDVNTTSLNQSITTLVNGSMVFMCGAEGSGRNFSSYGSGQTERYKDEGVSSTTSFAISTEVIASAGSDTQSYTLDSSANRLIMSVVSVPPTSSGSTVTLSGVDALAFTGLALFIAEAPLLDTVATNFTGKGVDPLDTVTLAPETLAFTGGDVSQNDAALLSKVALAFTGLPAATNEAFVFVKQALAFTGQSFTASIGVIIALAKLTLTYTGLALLTAQTYILTAVALAFTGLSAFFNDTTTLAKGALSFTGKTLNAFIGTTVELTLVALAFVGKALYLNEAFILAKAALAFTGKLLTLIVGGLEIFITGTLAFVGKFLATNEVFVLVKGALLFGGRAASAVVTPVGGAIRKGLNRLGNRTTTR